MPMGQSFFKEDVNNTVSPRNVYGSARGATVGVRASAATPYAAGGGGDYTNTVPTDSELGDATGRRFLGQPLGTFLVLVVLLVALMWGAKRFGSEGDSFKNVKLSLYNVVVIGLAAAIFFGLAKMTFGRLRVPGVSEYFLAI